MFNGERHEVKRWNEFLTEFCKILSEDYPDRFEDVLQRQPHIFSKNPAIGFPKDMSPKKIGGTDIYVKTS